MRTRRSPRNQEILWRALGNVQPAPHKICTSLPSRAEARVRMFAPKRCVDCAFTVGTVANLSLRNLDDFAAVAGETMECHMRDGDVCVGLQEYRAAKR